MVAQRAHQMLFLCCLQDVVVLIVTADRVQIAEAGFADFVKALLEDEEFQLGGHHRCQAQRVGARHLPLQYGARCMPHLFMRVVVQHITQDKCRAIQPGKAAQRRQVRLHDIVAIA
ncbi:MAG: Uncharacterised protein [SAR116 cluster bacterium]|nr:MAG: Uncharacterised protein [SAR116 cluster bacterium]